MQQEIGEVWGRWAFPGHIGGHTGSVVCAHGTPGDVKVFIAVVVTLLILELLLLLLHTVVEHPWQISQQYG
jgi:hypothetical protein